MKIISTAKSTLLILILFVLYLSGISQRYWVSAVPANWSGNNWSATSGGAPDGGGPPTAGVNAIFNANGSGDCVVDVAANFDGITTTGFIGTIDINGQTFSSSGVNNCIFGGGTINDTPGTSSLTINTTGIVRFNGTNFGASINASGGIDFNGGIFNASVAVDHNSSNQYGSGGCVFNAPLSITCSDTFEIRLGSTNPDIFNGTVNLNNSGSSSLRIAYNSIGNIFNDNIIFDAGAGSARISIGEGASSTVTFGAGISLSIGTDYLGGDLELRNVTQTDATPITLDLNGTSRFYIFGSTILGDVNVQAPRIYLRENIFSAPCYFLKEDATNDASYGGNTFTSDVQFHLTGSGYFMMGQTSPDIFNGVVTATNEGTSVIYLAHSSSGNQFNDDIILECTSASGIRISQGGGDATLANTKTISIGGLGFTDGALYLSNITQVGATNQSLNLDGTSSLQLNNNTFNGDIVFLAPGIIFNGNTFNGTANLTKEDVGTFSSTGGNTFNSTASFTNSGDNDWAFATSNPDIFNGVTTFTTNGALTARILPNRTAAGNQFNESIIVENDNSGGIYFGASGGTSTFAAGKSISIGALGFNEGILYLFNFSQTDATAISFTTTGNAITRLSNCNFQGSVDITSPGILVDANTFSSTVALEKTGGTTSSSAGGNTFNDVTTINNSGSASLRMAATNPDTFNAELNVNNTGSNYIEMSYGSAGNVYNENINVSSSSPLGIRFGQTAGSSSTLAGSKLIVVGVGGYSDGILQFRNFTQAGGTAQNLTLTGSSYFYSLNSDWSGNVSFIAPRLRTDGTNYQGTAYLEKSGAVADDQSQGNNIFASDVTLVNSGGNYFMMGQTNPDIYGGNLNAINSGTDNLHVAYSSTGNTVAGDLILSSINNAGTTQFCSSAASTLLVNGNTTITNTSSGATSTMYFPNGGSVTLGGSLDILQNASGATTNAYFANGASSSLIVNGNVQIQNNGSSSTTSRVYLGNSGSITVNGDLTIFGNSTATNSESYVNSGASSTGVINGNIIVESVVGNSGIRFGSGGGTTTLSDTYTITTGGGGYAGNYLYLRNFVQTGNTAQNIVTTGTSTILENYGSIWNANVDFSSARILLRNSVFQGTTTFTKTDAGNDYSVGSNTFNAPVTFTNAGTGEFRLSNNNGFADDYNSDVTFIETSSGEMRPSNNNSDTYSGNINFNSVDQIYMGAGANGRVILDGNSNQTLTDLVGGVLHRMRDFEVSKSGGDVYLATSFDIVSELDLNQGIVYSDVNNKIDMTDNSVVVNVSANSHIDGPIDKIGNDAFTFPVGDRGYYRPISITAPANAGSRFRAQYFYRDPDVDGYDDMTKVGSLGKISDCEYWILNRENLTNNVSVTLSFDSYDGLCSGVNDPTLLRVARWDGASMQWEDHGNGGSTGTTSGTLTTAGVVTSFSPFTFASDDITIDPLPITLVSFKAQPNGNEVDLMWQTASEINNAYFTIERSSNGIDFYPIATVEGAGNSTETINYEIADKNPLIGESFYRLKQTDFNGDFTYSPIETVIFNESTEGVNIYPNPLTSESRDINFVFNSSTERDIQIIDQLGKIVVSNISTSDIKLNLNLGQLEAGIYFIRITENDHTYSERIILE